MNTISSIHIEGFKKFTSFDAAFNEHLNVLVGSNEAGKSTILDAIGIVMNQRYQNTDKAFLKDLFNIEQINAFENTPIVDNLPYIYIELELILNDSDENSEYFWGENNHKKVESFGIVFECCINTDLSDMIDNYVADGKIPYEYYSLKWTTFAGLPYYQAKKPFNFLYINTSDNSASASFNYYNKTLFNSTYDKNIRMNAKNKFRDGLNAAFDNIGLDDIDVNRKFGINDKKVILETIISVFEDSIPIENRGSGMESLIKTQIALDKAKSKLNVILIEEPENHLCFTNMNKMIEEISKQQETAQLIISTHSSMIATRLNLNNVLWILDKNIYSLKQVRHGVAEYFQKLDNNNFLQFLLSERVILVEGATEYLLMPKLYKKNTGRSVEADGITIISCNGISYKNYIEIAKGQNKKIVVITDNDNKDSKISSALEFNKSNESCRIFMGDSTDDWTWEAAFYNINKEYFDNLIDVDQNSDYLFNKNDYGKVLGKMLNNKVATAYQMLKCNDEFEIPNYIKDAIKWITES